MQTEQELANLNAGTFGVEYLSDTSPHTGLFGKFIALTDATIAALKCEPLSGNTLAGAVIPKGATVHLPRVTSITLTSGTLLAYRQTSSL